MDRYRYGIRKTAYADEDVVTLEKARANCSVDGDEHDDMLADLLEEARSYFEDRTGCSLTTTTWEMTIDAFPRSKWLNLPRWPLQSVESITYTAADGSEATIAAEEIAIRKGDDDRGRIALKDWAGWPETKATPDAVRISFKAGWADPQAVPRKWNRALLMLISWWFEQREGAILGGANTVPLGIDALIDSAAAVGEFDSFDLCE
ncbi:head-tail connector protein [Aureliella helgolandensis]|uniref:Phage gp6-like head-tail connector protein n=1 Tax=Aureliella helgolandensis TaxID=2527968 RepID=A0A518G722_9BACT|nr:head-tail connector protein [Aureliella helgolandensis]QDV24390.1 Phage gp6-like head-tail connector protein [Aureliella helgolandensis]